MTRLRLGVKERAHKAHMQGYELCLHADYLVRCHILKADPEVASTTKRNLKSLGLWTEEPELVPKKRRRTNCDDDVICGDAASEDCERGKALTNGDDIGVASTCGGDVPDDADGIRPRRDESSSRKMWKQCAAGKLKKWLGMMQPIALSADES